MVPPPPPPPPPPTYYWAGTPGQHPPPTSYPYGYSYGSGYTSGSATASGFSSLGYMGSVPGAAPRNVHPYASTQHQTAFPTSHLYSTSPSKPRPATSTDTAVQQVNTWECDSCNVTLDSEKAFKSHRKSHVKCTECSFEGVPKIVKAHYQALHGKFSGSGFKTVTVAIPGCRVQKFKICVGNRPEDIQRWIAERKKRFPRRSPQQNDNALDTAGISNNPGASQTNTNSSTLDATKDATKDAMKDASASSGLSALLAGYGSDSDLDSDNNDEQVETKPQDKLAIEDSEVSEIPPQVEAPIQVDAAPPEDDGAASSKIPPKRSCRFFFQYGSCRNGDSCRFSHEIPPPTRQTASQNASHQHNDRKRKRGGHTSSDTLLRKLLENDMDRESNLTMQLLKYIVQNNFFDAGTTNAK
jgi:Zinc finger C-x8-C-x5-C-x3-H type (and similar)/Nuclear fragile X mental retardation-interacting protein 1 (NUFIP1)/Zinc-finger of C2H2 type